MIYTILAFFTNNGTPQNELEPTVKIREVSTGNLIVAGGSGDIMSELGDGWYKYDFDLDEEKDYVIVCDGGEEMPTSERYVYAGTEFRHVSKKVDIIEQVELGRWKIDKDTKEMIFYKDDNVTEIARFKLYDIFNEPNISGVLERKRL